LARSDFHRLDSIERFHSLTEHPPFPDLSWRDESPIPRNPSTAREAVLRCEVAATDTARGVGLMFREELPPDEGMLFIYPKPSKLNFYMRNTKIPLSIAFLDDDGKILQIEDMKPYDERGVRSKNEVRYAVEANQGWFEKNGFAAGSGGLVADFAKTIQNLAAR
jgi:hypothetical protein